jgi:hypothetical protein
MLFARWLSRVASDVGKHTKLKATAASSDTKHGETDGVDPLDLIERVLTRQIAAMEVALGSGTATPALARESAACARALLEAQSMRQKRERAAAKQVDDITVADMIARARRMSPREWEAVKLEVERRPKSGLA